jgi:SAM-dependent methyltransferase
MSSQAASTKNWFGQGGSGYAQFRPEYPEALAAWLASLSPERGLAVDVGCGNGQLTTQLAAHFQRVVGLDPSADQIAHANAHPGVNYLCAPAEELPMPTGSAHLVTAAQAAHWFELPRFYAEVQRIAAPGAHLALISYGAPQLDPTLARRFEAFYAEEIGPWWPAERKRVDSGYADLPFPFEELTPPALEICKAWPLAQWLGYVYTWSAVKRALEAGRPDLFERFAEDCAALWGEPTALRQVRWPIRMRVGALPSRTPAPSQPL